MAVFHFPLKDIAALVAHSRAAPTRQLSYAERFDASLARPGATPQQFGGYSDANIDMTRLVPCLFLVKDNGLYLMSPGIPKLPNPTDPKRHLVVQSVETRGGDPHNNAAAAGGDDFVEIVPLADIERLAAGGREYLVASFSDEIFEVWIK